MAQKQSPETRSTKDMTVAGGGKSLRDSNLELLRVVAMLVIIAHHYVTASNIQGYYDFTNPSSQQYFLEIFGMWGKTAINSFVLISGYFLCKGNLTCMRWLKLFAEIFFYHLVVNLFFILKGDVPLRISTLIPDLTQYIRYINGAFTSSFLVFYAFIPILNKTIRCLSRREHIFVCLGLLGIFTISDTFFHAKVFNEPFWYMTLFFIAAYIRFYPNKFTESLKITSTGFIITSLLSILSVVVLTYIGRGDARYVLLVDSDKIFAFAVGLLSFLAFKNLPSFHNRMINFLAEGTFAVYLVHTAGSNMLKWLWGDLLHVDDMYFEETPVLILHAIISVILIFIICSVLDVFRRKFIERPLMTYMSMLLPRFRNLLKSHAFC